jgi:hypothetical protein
MVRVSSTDEVVIGHRGTSWWGVLILFVKAHQVVIVEIGALSATVNRLVIVKVE